MGRKESGVRIQNSEDRIQKKSMMDFLSRRTQRKERHMEQGIREKSPYLVLYLSSSFIWKPVEYLTIMNAV
jgi:hypothetical protein